MGRFIKPLQNHFPSASLREIAPGIWIQVRRAPRLADAPAMLHNVRDRIHDAWSSLTRKPQHIDLQDYLKRIDRKAA